MRLLKFGVLLFCVLAIFGFSTTSSAQNVQNFTFESFHGTYELSRDDEGRALMRVTERIVAEFPEFNQNKGIVREIPRTYQGRPLSFEFISLTRNGQPEPVYDQSRSGKFMVISTGTDDFVRGTQAYELTYQLRDVILETDGAQELFWDINGTGWRQPFGSVRAVLQLDESLQDSLTGRVTCFQGSAGSQELCQYNIDADGSIDFNSTRSFSPGENLSIVVEFEPDTFAPFKEGPAGIVLYAISMLAVLASIITIRNALSFSRRNRNHPGRGLAVRQYIPPKDISVMLAAVVSGKQRLIQKSVTAQLLELAVNKHIKLIDTGRKRALGFGKNTYEIEITNLKDIPKEGAELIKAFFDTDYHEGATHELHKSSSTTGQKLASLQQKLKARALSAGYRRKTKGIGKPLVQATIASIIGVTLLVSMNVIGLSFNIVSDARTWAILLSFLSFGLSTVLVLTSLRPLTEKGRELADYLEGMKEYISLAETERLRFAQSPGGAQRQRVNTDDPGEVIRLYERLLPYAVLFGEEKKWFQELGKYYEQQNSQPAWYAGTTSFSASNFSSSMSQISSAASASSSSSSGFSGGGGSGGGGGGGGGGGR